EGVSEMLDHHVVTLDVLEHVSAHDDVPGRFVAVIEEIDLPHLEVVEPQAALDAVRPLDGLRLVVGDGDLPAREAPGHVIGERAFTAAGVQERARRLVPQAAATQLLHDVPAPQATRDVSLTEGLITAPPLPLRLSPRVLATIDHVRW